MKPLTKFFWELLDQQYEGIAKHDKNFIFNKDKYDEFHIFFEQYYLEIKTKYMSKDVEYLDRHKVAAILIIAVLKNDVINYRNIDNNIFIGAELLSVKAALAYMLEKLNEKLSIFNKKIDEVKFPEAISCDTPYIEIICRNLFYSKRDFELNPLDLSEKLFLLEQIWLLNEGIDPRMLKSIQKMPEVD